MSENEWTPGTLYWYEEEVKRLQTKIERLQALILRLKHEAEYPDELGDIIDAALGHAHNTGAAGDTAGLEAEIKRLRAALEEISNEPRKIVGPAKEIARKVLAKEQSSGENKQ